MADGVNAVDGIDGPAMRLVVTRPQPQADAWVRRLAAAGLDAVALPLIGIAPAADAAPVAALWQALAAQRFVMFVSANAVDAFFAARPEGAAWPGATRAGATGPGTTAALAAVGVPRESIDAPPEQAARFDAEALWARIEARDWAAAQVVVVRGEGGRDWLAERFAERGAVVRFVAAYRRVPPAWGEAERRIAQEALADPARHLWLATSSEALAHLGALCPGADWGRAVAIATHPRIAAAARALGFGRVVESGPRLDELAAAARSVQCPAP